jgi:hypothetical protein
MSKGIYRKNKAWVRRLAESALALPAPEPEKAPEPRKPTPVNSDTEDQEEMRNGVREQLRKRQR